MLCERAREANNDATSGETRRRLELVLVGIEPPPMREHKFQELINYLHVNTTISILNFIKNVSIYVTALLRRGRKCVT